MLTRRHLATIRAALAFWRDEMVPHGRRAAKAYFDGDRHRPLTKDELAAAAAHFAATNLRYVLVDDRTSALLVEKLTVRPPVRRPLGGSIATALLSPDQASEYHGPG